MARTQIVTCDLCGSQDGPMDYATFTRDGSVQPFGVDVCLTCGVTRTIADLAAFIGVKAEVQ
jgi:hypothetical protein